jgi:hypothetical protein
MYNRFSRDFPAIAKTTPEGGVPEREFVESGMTVECFWRFSADAPPESHPYRPLPANCLKLLRKLDNDH